MNMVKPLIHKRGCMMAIRYRINYTKAIETILWLVNEKPDIDIYHIGKAIFYAEKYHLNRYARPIIGDIYQKGEYGPFPSTIRDIIQHKTEWLDPDQLQESTKAFDVVNNPYPTPIPKRLPNIDYFSGTDLECLKKALNEVGDLSFDELKKLTHEEESFLSAIENNQINYELLIDRDNPLRNEIIKEMREINRYVCL